MTNQKKNIRTDELFSVKYPKMSSFSQVAEALTGLIYHRPSGENFSSAFAFVAQNTGKEQEVNGSTKESNEKSLERASENCNLLSEYAKQLDLYVRKRCLQKISVIRIDPVLIPEENSSQNVYHLTCRGS